MCVAISGIASLKITPIGSTSVTFPEESRVTPWGEFIHALAATTEMLPKTLHWFKWEAAITWLSGVSLFILLYYAGGLISAGNPLELTNMQAIGISLATIVIGWFIYDLLWISPLANQWNVAVVISYALLVGAIYGFTHIFSGRAAYLQTGALLGTFMAFNVWVRILPAQRSLIAAVSAGQQPNMMLAERAKNRSTHNTFMVVPVVFMMLSNHFPVATYSYSWMLLSVLVRVPAALRYDHHPPLSL